MATATSEQAVSSSDKQEIGGQMIRRDPRVTNIQNLLLRSKEGLQQALPKHLTAERMIRVAMTAIQKVPKLLECDQRSLIGAIVEASQLGLEPDGVLGHAYLVPYANRKTGNTICQLIVGYKGLIDLTRRTGTIKTIEAHIVREKDEFDYEFGLDPKLKHKPSRVPDPGKPIYAYAVGHLTNEGVQFEVMTVREIEAIRARSRASKDGPWVTDWEAMAKKTVLRRLAKLLPVSVEAQRAIALDERDDTSIAPINLGVGLDLALPEPDPEEFEAVEVEEEKKPENLDALADKLAPRQSLAEAQATAQERIGRPTAEQMTQFGSLTDSIGKCTTLDQVDYMQKEVEGFLSRGQISEEQAKALKASAVTKSREIERGE